jgi:NAD(P)-dependent dehydrogenase (short-subunit alcohol dehydrogenase family)
LSERDSGVGGLVGRAALVMGASSGLGQAVAIALAEAGADVAQVARSENDLREKEEQVSRTSRRPFYLSAVGTLRSPSPRSPIGRPDAPGDDPFGEDADDRPAYCGAVIRGGLDGGG